MSEHSVFVIDDDDAVRDSILCLLRSQGVRARAFASGVQFFDNLPDVPSACVITDVRMPGMDGPEVVRRLRALKGVAWPIVVITGHAEVPLAVQLMKAGVVDYIEKPFEPNRLVEVVRGSFAHMDNLLLQKAQTDAALQRMARLTPREREVFHALVQGRTNKHIANDLQISPRTVEIFRARVMEKMEAETLSELIRTGLKAAPDGAVEALRLPGELVSGTPGPSGAPSVH
ncbi:MAG: response regulator [Alphaproteobacteria bacterium]|nr:response regulator [Alphaproteobacteria bacterium]MBU2270993.1 response regulator [Alphaproteobacteria bacterium]MBU2417962.1 response regulator [Alphaproteobacteria bacterium]